MERRIQFSRVDVLAVVCGVAAFACLSLLRIEATYQLHPPEALGLVLTLLMYLIPGALVGLMAPTSPLKDGVTLGALTTLVVLVEVPLRPGFLPAADIARVAAAFLGIGVVACSIGCLAGARLRSRANDL
jgi:hypothetical protein